MAGQRLSSRLNYVDDIGNGRPGGRTPEQIDLLRRVFQGMEIVDAKADVLINAKDEDFKGSTPNHLENCVFARACRRLYDSGVMLFMASVAYVDMPDEDGVRKVHRFIMGWKLRGAIRVMDESGGTKFVPGVFRLHAPPRANRLDYIRENSRQRRKDPAYRAKKAESQRHRKAAIVSRARTVKTRHRAGTLGILRSGSGLVQTSLA